MENKEKERRINETALCPDNENSVYNGGTTTERYNPILKVLKKGIVEKPYFSQSSN